MNSNIKQSIMDTARQLFNEKGFQHTSMRDIASALDISVGNLTYHYKKKEDLIEAIALQDHEKYQKPELLHTFDDLNQLFLKNIDQKNSRPYYFRHYVQLSQICPSIYRMQVSVLKDLSDVLTASFEIFVKEGYLREDLSQEYDQMIMAIMTLMVYGIPDFYQMELFDRNMLTLNCIWSILIPCMTQQGLEEYQKVNDQV